MVVLCLSMMRIVSRPHAGAAVQMAITARGRVVRCREYRIKWRNISLLAGRCAKIKALAKTNDSEGVSEFFTRLAPCSHTRVELIALFEWHGMCLALIRSKTS